MTEQPPPTDEPREPALSADRPERDEVSVGVPAVAIGLLLVLLGGALFLGQLLNVGIDDVGWPLFVIAAGVAILVIGLVVVNEEGIVVAGTIVTTVGLVLLYQDATGRWETWAYAWALVGPAASGLGLILWGVRSGDGTYVRNGTWALLSGLGLFVVGFLFFEGVIGIGGDPLDVPEWLLPVVVIVIGIVVLARGLFERRQAT